jgi:hypothetical protein
VEGEGGGADGNGAGEVEAALPGEPGTASVAGGAAGAETPASLPPHPAAMIAMIMAAVDRTVPATALMALP